MKIGRSRLLDPVQEDHCAHRVRLNPELIVLGCASGFSDGSSRKYQVYRQNYEWTDKPAQPKFLMSTSVPNSMISRPDDALELLRYSENETDLIYGVGSTLARTRIMIGNTEDQSWVAKREEVNFGGNMCVTDKKFRMQLMITPVDFGGRAFVYMYGNQNPNKQSIKVHRMGLCASTGC